MSNKLNEYLAQQKKADELKQAAIDEAISNLVACIESTFEAAEQVREISPDYEFNKLSKFRKLTAKFGLNESEASKPEGRKEVGNGKSKTGKAKSGFKLSDEKAKEILDFIGAGDKSTQEIADKLKTKNASNALTYLKNEGKIKVAKKEGLKKFWKRV
jgi:hypothetical protein